MTRQKKTARARAAFNLNTRLTCGVAASNLTSPKQFVATLMNQTQLYTILRTSHKQTALVSPKHCEFVALKLADLQERLNPGNECATSQPGRMYRDLNLVSSFKNGVCESRTEATILIHVVVLALQVMLRPLFQKIRGKYREALSGVAVQSRRANYV